MYSVTFGSELGRLIVGGAEGHQLASGIMVPEISVLIR